MKLKDIYDCADALDEIEAHWADDDMELSIPCSRVMRWAAEEIEYQRRKMRALENLFIGAIFALLLCVLFWITTGGTP